MIHLLQLITLVAIMTGASSLVCISCSTSNRESACYSRQEDAGTNTCGPWAKHCVVERHTDASNNLVRLVRRCVRPYETEIQNRCEELDSGVLQCFTYCQGAECNTGSARLNYRGRWGRVRDRAGVSGKGSRQNDRDYTDPDYSDRDYAADYSDDYDRQEYRGGGGAGGLARSPVCLVSAALLTLVSWSR